MADAPPQHEEDGQQTLPHVGGPQGLAYNEHLIVRVIYIEIRSICITEQTSLGPVLKEF